MLIQSSTDVISSSVTSTPPVLEKNATKPDTSSPAQAVGLKEPTSQELKNAVDILNKAVKENHTNLDISIDSNTKEMVVKVVDSSNGDVITQFPSKVALAISATIDNKQQGVLLNNKA